jgi:hypothetical protein
MTIFISALAVAFAALCVWLTVRIVNRRERWAKRTALILAMVLAYLVSFGPACWISSRTNRGAELMDVIYQPMTWGMTLSYDKSPLDYALTKYAEIGAPYGWKWRRTVSGGIVGETWHWCG